MFNVGGGEILVILLVALLVLGPDKLPEAARNAGKLYRQVRQISSGFQQELREAIGDEPAAGTASSTSRSTGARSTVHPDAGAGPSLPPLAPAAAAGADGSAAAPQAGIGDLDDLVTSSDGTDTADGRAADRADGDTEAAPTLSEGRPVHVDGPGASFS